MRDYFITFGVQYGHGKNQMLHPVFDWIDANGYVRLTAPSENIARRYTNYMVGGNWAFMDTEAPKAEFAPLGELAHWTVG